MKKTLISLAALALLSGAALAHVTTGKVTGNTFVGPNTADPAEPHSYNGSGDDDPSTFVPSK